MIYGDVASGYSAPSLAWKPLGWRPAFYSEIEKFPRRILMEKQDARPWRKSVEADVTPLRGDFTNIKGSDHEPIRLLVGGTPCQDFSIAGLRKGLSGDRGDLSLEFFRLVQRTKPAWVVWENVPGVLSSHGGRDFGAILGALEELGYGWAYRTLDAQYVRTHRFQGAVPQRRRRVFVVGYSGNLGQAGNPTSARLIQRFSKLSAAVLFEREGLSGNPPPRREAGQVVAPTVSARPSGGGGLGTDFDLDGGLIQQVFGAGQISGPRDVAAALTAHGMQLDFDSENFVTTQYGDVAGTLSARHDSSPCADRGQNIVAFSSKDDGRDAVSGVSPTLRSMNSAKKHPNAGGQVAIAIQERALSENPDAGPAGKGWRDDGAAFTLEARSTVQAVGVNLRGRDGDGTAELSGDVATALRASSGGGDKSHVLTESIVRRLTVIECERLQGAPDDYTRIPWRGKPAWKCPNGNRYKAIGNSMAINVMAWLGRRIDLVDAFALEMEAAGQW